MAQQQIYREKAIRLKLQTGQVFIRVPTKRLTVTLEELGDPQLGWENLFRGQLLMHLTNLAFMEKWKEESHANPDKKA